MGDVKSRLRVRQTLDHREPDRVPFDLGGTRVSTIHVTAYQHLRRHLQLPPMEPNIAYVGEQLVQLDDDLAKRLQTDVRPVLSPGAAADHQIEYRDEGSYQAMTDEWGVRWHMRKQGGLYYDMYHHPLAQATTLAELKSHPFPDPLDDGRFETLRDQAETAVAAGKAVVLLGPSAGIAETYSWMRGYEEYYVDLARNKDWVGYMLDRLVEWKGAFWQRALRELGDLVDIVSEGDDLGSQTSLLMSPHTYRELLKPRHRRLFGLIKDQAPVKVFLHSCGAIRPLIPELIEAGVDILNPVQISAVGMDLAELKREYGRDLAFWGGGVDTQVVLGRGTPMEVKQHVRRNIEILAPGGGFVFATVHNIQANHPPENIMAMWEAWLEYGSY